MMIKSNNISYLLSLIMLILILSACGRDPEKQLPGYIEGKYVYISSSFPGALKKLFVKSGDIVDTNQPLYALDEQPEHDELTSVSARIQEALEQKSKNLANYNLKKSQFKRDSFLYKKDIITKEQFDISESNLLQAKAEYDSIEKKLQSLNADKNVAYWKAKQKIVSAPVAGLIYDTYYLPGELVPSYSSILSILPNNLIKVIFFVPEPMLSQVRINQLIEIKCDNCVNALVAKVNYISPQAEYTPPVIYSSDQRAKLVYRIEAVSLDPNVFNKLHPGQPITVFIDL
jgi:HlyD family secretion protein